MEKTSTEELKNALSNWIARAPDGAVRLVEQLVSDQEYGPYVKFRLTPAFYGSCAVEIDSLESGPYIGISVEKWSEIANRLSVKFSTSGYRTDDFCAIFFEPRIISVRDVIDILDAISQGRVSLKAVVVFGRLVCTNGHIDRECGKLVLNGVGGPYWFFRMLSLVRISRIRTMECSPWWTTT